MTIDPVTKPNLLPEVQEFLGKETHGAVIGGEEVMASDGGLLRRMIPGAARSLRRWRT